MAYRELDYTLVSKLKKLIREKIVKTLTFQHHKNILTVYGLFTLILFMDHDTSCFV